MKDQDRTSVVLSVWTSEALADSAILYHQAREGYNYIYRAIEREVNKALDKR